MIVVIRQNIFLTLILEKKRLLWLVEIYDMIHYRV